MNYRNIPIADAHIHVFWDMLLEKKYEYLKGLIEKHNYDTVTILSLPVCSSRLVKSRNFLENLIGFYLKTKMPGKIYNFAGFSHYYDDSKNTPEFFLK